VNERNLSRGLSTIVVEALKAQGHILVVKGGATALAREIGELMAPALATASGDVAEIGPRVVDELAASIARALMSSDHVEDVFAEDQVIRRDVLRALREGLAAPPRSEDEAAVSVRLDTLGYVAATVSRRADPETLQQALDRAAAVSHARFVSYHAEQHEAVFRVDGGGPDERLELEEAVADELADLAEQGVTPLPTIERRIALGRAVDEPEQEALAARLDAAAEVTLFRSGCAAEWAFADPRALRVVFTPLSEQDARDVEAPAAAFAREVATILGAATAAPVAVPAIEAAPATLPEAPAATAAPAESKPARAKKTAEPKRKRTPESSAGAVVEGPKPKRSAAKSSRAKKT
jgi:hypothetical protein